MPWTPIITRSDAEDAYWGTQTKEPATQEVEQSETTLACWKVTFVYTRQTPSATREDTMTFSLAIAKQVAGGLFGIGLTSELATIEVELNKFAALIANKQSSAITLSEYVWHVHRANNPPAVGGGEKPGPAVKRTAKSVAGANATSRTPDQIAATITWRTASRKHWGRIYVPGLRLSAWDTTYGRLTNVVCDDLALAARSLVNDLNTAGYELGVWTYKKKAFLPILEVHCDDVVDIQRRRRAKQRNYMKVYSS